MNQRMRKMKDQKQKMNANADTKAMRDASMPDFFDDSNDSFCLSDAPSKDEEPDCFSFVDDCMEELRFSGESESTLVISNIHKCQHDSFSSCHLSSSTLPTSNVTDAPHSPVHHLADGSDHSTSSGGLDRTRHSCSRWESVQDAPSKSRARLPLRLPCRTDSPLIANPGAPKKPTRKGSGLELKRGGPPRPVLRVGSGLSVPVCAVPRSRSGNKSHMSPRSVLRVPSKSASPSSSGRMKKTVCWQDASSGREQLKSSNCAAV